MFKNSFKYYKAKWPPPDFKDVVSFDSEELKGVLKVHLQKQDVQCLPLGVIPTDQWKCVELVDRPGLIFIKNPFTARGQRYWIARCLRDYPKSPNIVNLSPKNFTDDMIKDWWSVLQNTKDKELRRKLKNSLRWTTLGYHHDWDTKIYSEKMKHKFPDDLNKLSSFFADVLGLGKYSAEAAIVNYYPIGTTLAGHTDHSEADLEAPLFSFSFGQTAIFLIGGTTKEEKPTALFLKSGDVIVMSKSSRLCYHAVPRVMKADDDPWNKLEEKEDDGDNSFSEPPDPKRPKVSTEYTFGMDLDLWRQCFDNKFWNCYNNYLSDSRININVRQVLKEGQTSL